MENIVCPRCNGNKQLFAHINMGNQPHEWNTIDCFRCNGKGFVTEEQLIAIEEGKLIKKQLRLERKTLMEKSIELNMPFHAFNNCVNGDSRILDNAIRKIYGLPKI